MYVLTFVNVLLHLLLNIYQHLLKSSTKSLLQKSMRFFFIHYHGNIFRYLKHVRVCAFLLYNLMFYFEVVSELHACITYNIYYTTQVKVYNYATTYHQTSE